jgi:hypothetical protein
VVVEPGVELSAEVAEAAWIADRLSSFDSGFVTSVVPGGFEAYARVLHPVEEARRRGDRPVRWSEVAAWSGAALVPGGQFADIALPEHEPVGVEPWSGGGPREGTLYRPDADVLGEVLAVHTSTRDRCWFCMWERWGPSSSGPRVQLPGRDYLLFVGPLPAMPSLLDSQEGRTPNLWWPDDHAWCVASEIDLPWTYIGGSAALIAGLLADDRLEVQPGASADNHHQRAPDWLEPAITEAATKLLDSGAAALPTWRGTVRMQLEWPQSGAGGSLRTQRESRDGNSRGSGWMRIGDSDPVRLREIVTSSLITAVIDLV